MTGVTNKSFCENGTSVSKKNVACKEGVMGCSGSKALPAHPAVDDRRFMLASILLKPYVQPLLWKTFKGWTRFLEVQNEFKKINDAIALKAKQKADEEAFKASTGVRGLGEKKKYVKPKAAPVDAALAASIKSKAAADAEERRIAKDKEEAERALRLKDKEGKTESALLYQQEEILLQAQVKAGRVDNMNPLARIEEDEEGDSFLAGVNSFHKAKVEAASRPGSRPVIGQQVHGPLSNKPVVGLLAKAAHATAHAMERMTHIGAEIRKTRMSRATKARNSRKTRTTRITRMLHWRSTKANLDAPGDTADDSMPSSHGLPRPSSRRTENYWA
jgi:hypothetical protein